MFGVGAILIDKQAGITSAEVIRRFKKSYAARVKIGHSGTLDPMATGLLVLLLGKATKLQGVLLQLPKIYHGKILLGRRTTTDDVTGDTLEELPVSVTQEVVKDLASQFLGPVEQRPPSYSALKVNGKRSYELARSGNAVELAKREVTFHSTRFDLISENEIAYEVCCSSGTYIRSLARDLGENLGCGACLSAIRRVGEGGFSVDAAVSSEQLDDSSLLESAFRSLEDSLLPFPSMNIEEDVCRRVRHGDQECLEGIPIEEQGFLVLKTPIGEVCALAEAVDGKWAFRAVF